MRLFNNKILLITGGTGTIGNAVLQRLIQTNIKEIRVFSRDEKKQDDMRCQIQCSKIKYFIGDIRDKRSIDFAMKNVNFVFHAAALKQVNSCELFPMEAFKTNVLGTENIIDSAIQHQVERLVVLSTDKAVYPVSAMGLSKAMMEKIMLAKSYQYKESMNTILSGTRFGNVMISRGSVIPKFIEQIKANKDLHVTNPEMTRFMMSIEEAVDLILYTFQNAQSGDIFIKKAPIVKIGLLAQALIELYNSPVSIHVKGSHSGEKISEELMNFEETLKMEDDNGYYRIPRDFRLKEANTETIKLNSDIFDYLNLEATKNLLLHLDAIKKDIS